MDARAIHIVNIDASGRCAAIATDQLLVLARSQSVSHDAGFQRSRELAEEFCARVHDVASMASITADRVALLARGLLSDDRWNGWCLSFCIVQQVDCVLRSLNCGSTCLILVGDDGAWRPLLRPQTVGRKLRREGATNVPLHVEHIAATMASADLSPSDIDGVVLERGTGMMVIAAAEPRLIESLPDLVDDATSSDAIAGTVFGALDSLTNPCRSFVVWLPATR